MKSIAGFERRAHVTARACALRNAGLPFGSDVTDLQRSDAYPAGLADVPANAVVGKTRAGTVTTTTDPVGFTPGSGTPSTNRCM